MASNARKIGSGEDAERDFEARFLESYPAVYNYVRSRADRGTAEDIISEAFLTAARSFRSFDPTSTDFSAWVIAIAEDRLASAPCN